MDKVYKWRLVCDTHGTVYNYNEDDSTPPKCPHNDQDAITANSEVIVETLEKQMRKTQTILSQDGLTRHPKGYQFVATKNSTTEHYFLIDEEMALRGGSLECENHAFGDYYSFDIVDKDGNVYAAGHVITNYINKQNIRKSGLNEMEDESISDPIPANLFYFRITYKSVGTVDDVKCNLDVLAYI